MALQFVVDSLESVPEAHRPLYAEKDGKFILGVEGAVSSDKLTEFRDNNRTLKRQNDELTAKFADIDPEKYRELTAQEQKLRDKQLIDSGKVDELIAERVAAMRGDHDKQLKAVAGERDGMKKQLESLVIDGALRDAASKAGVAPTAIDDVLLRGRGTFRLVDGKAVAMDGDKQIFGKDGESLGVTEWVGGLAEKAPHLFPPSTGGGAPKGGVGSGGTGKTLTRAQFEALDPVAKFAAVKDTKIVD